MGMFLIFRLWRWISQFQYLVNLFKEENPLNPPNHEDLEAFWNDWWDNKLKTCEGKKRMGRFNWNISKPSLIE